MTNVPIPFFESRPRAQATLEARQRHALSMSASEHCLASLPVNLLNFGRGAFARLSMRDARNCIQQGSGALIQTSSFSCHCQRNIFVLQSMPCSNLIETNRPAARTPRDPHSDRNLPTKAQSRMTHRRRGHLLQLDRSRIRNSRSLSLNHISLHGNRRRGHLRNPSRSRS